MQDSAFLTVCHSVPGSDSNAKALLLYCECGGDRSVLSGCPLELLEEVHDAIQRRMLALENDAANPERRSRINDSMDMLDGIQRYVQRALVDRYLRFHIPQTGEQAQGWIPRLQRVDTDARNIIKDWPLESVQMTVKVLERFLPPDVSAMRFVIERCRQFLQTLFEKPAERIERMQRTRERCILESLAATLRAVMHNEPRAVA